MSNNLAVSLLPADPVASSDPMDDLEVLESLASHARQLRRKRDALGAVTAAKWELTLSRSIAYVRSHHLIIMHLLLCCGIWWPTS